MDVIEFEDNKLLFGDANCFFESCPLTLFANTFSLLTLLTYFSDYWYFTYTDSKGGVYFFEW